MDPVTTATASGLSQRVATKRYARYLNSLRPSQGNAGDLDELMNVVIRKKLRIIPNDVQ